MKRPPAVFMSNITSTSKMVVENRAWLYTVPGIAKKLNLSL